MRSLTTTRIHTTGESLQSSLLFVESEEANSLTSNGVWMAKLGLHRLSAVEFGNNSLLLVHDCV